MLCVPGTLPMCVPCQCSRVQPTRVAAKSRGIYWRDDAEENLEEIPIKNASVLFFHDPPPLPLISHLSYHRHHAESAYRRSTLPSVFNFDHILSFPLETYLANAQVF